MIRDKGIMLNRLVAPQGWLNPAQEFNNMFFGMVAALRLGAANVNSDAGVKA